MTDKVFKVGTAAVREGKRDADLEAVIRAFVDTIAYHGGV